MSFNKKVYWDRRKKGFRGQIPVPGTKEFAYEQHRIDKLARKLHIERLKRQEIDKEIP